MPAGAILVIIIVCVLIAGCGGRCRRAARCGRQRRAVEDKAGVRPARQQEWGTAGRQAELAERSHRVAGNSASSPLTLQVRQENSSHRGPPPRRHSLKTTPGGREGGLQPSAAGRAGARVPRRRPGAVARGPVGAPRPATGQLPACGGDRCRAGLCVRAHGAAQAGAAVVPPPMFQELARVLGKPASPTKQGQLQPDVEAPANAAHVTARRSEAEHDGDFGVRRAAHPAKVRDPGDPPAGGAVRGRARRRRV